MTAWDQHDGIKISIQDPRSIVGVAVLSYCTVQVSRIVKCTVQVRLVLHCLWFNIYCTGLFNHDASIFICMRVREDPWRVHGCNNARTDADDSEVSEAMTRVIRCDDVL